MRRIIRTMLDRPDLTVGVQPGRPHRRAKGERRAAPGNRRRDPRDRAMPIRGPLLANEADLWRSPHAPREPPTPRFYQVLPQRRNGRTPAKHPLRSGRTPYDQDAPPTIRTHPLRSGRMESPAVVVDRVP